MLVFVVGLLRVSKVMHGCCRSTRIGYEVASRRFHQCNRGSEAIIVKAIRYEKRGFFGLRKSARLKFAFDQRAPTYVIVESEKRTLRTEVMDIRSFRSSTK